MKNENDALSSGFAAGLKLLEESGGDCLKIIPKTAAGDPLGLLVIVRGKDAAKEMLAAVEAVEDQW